MEEGKYVINTDNSEKAGAIMMIFDHYFANYKLTVGLRKDVEGNLVSPKLIYSISSTLNREQAKAIRHDIKQMNNPPSVRIASDGSDYLFNLRAY